MKPDTLLRRLRLTLGLTQQQLADALEVSRQTISDNERGAARVPKERIMATLLLALGQLQEERRIAARLRRPFL